MPNQHTKNPVTVAERFWAKVNKTATCWQWTACCDRRGYGKFNLNGKMVRAHCVAWEWAYGAVPAGHELHHQCGHKGCVRPDHLVAVTHKEHTYMEPGNPFAIRGQATSCKRGHAFTTENTYYFVNAQGGRSRACRACWKVRYKRSEP